MNEPVSTSVHFSAALRIAAKVVSVIFHPLFIPLYITLYLVFIQRLEFLSLTEPERFFVVAHIAIFSVFFPAFSVFLLSKLKFIDNIYMRTQKERIIPYIISMIFFFWTFYLFKNKISWPQVMTQLYLGIFICIIIAVVANNFFKISMHGMAMGGALAFMIILLLNGLLPSVLPLIITIALCGIVCTSRLIVNAHRPFDVYAGLLAGFASQMIATRFVDLHL